MTDPKKTATSHGLPRGADRVRRRAKQEQAKTLEVLEASNLTSPSTPEKAAAIEANKAKQAQAGTTAKEVRERKQEAHKAAAVAEVARLGERTVDTPLAAFTPGQQVDHVTARRLMKRMNADARDENREAALEAARAVRGVLDGKRPLGASRARRAARHAAAAAAAAQTQQG